MQLRGGQHDEGDDEQDEAQLDQRRGVKQSPSASVNSLAMVAEIVVPGANSEDVMLWALPITKVTAMVSPSARPSASIAPPTTPMRV